MNNLTTQTIRDNKNNQNLSMVNLNDINAILRLDPMQISTLTNGELHIVASTILESEYGNSMLLAHRHMLKIKQSETVLPYALEYKMSALEDYKKASVRPLATVGIGLPIYEMQEILYMSCKSLAAIINCLQPPVNSLSSYRSELTSKIATFLQKYKDPISKVAILIAFEATVRCLSFYNRPLFYSDVRTIRKYAYYCLKKQGGNIIDINKQNYYRKKVHIT